MAKNASTDLQRLPDEGVPLDRAASRDLEQIEAATRHLRAAWRTLTPLGRRRPMACGLVLEIASMMGDLAGERGRIEAEAGARDFDAASLRLDELTVEDEALRRALAQTPMDARLSAALLVCEAEKLSIEGALKL